MTKEGVNAVMASTHGAADQAQEAPLARAAEVTGPELLTYAAHSDSEVRAVVAARPDCPISAFISLGYDHAPEVLRALLENPATPASVVRKLADHREPSVSDVAIQRLRNSSL